MAEPQVSILLRKGPHDGTTSNATTRVRYALLCDNFSVQIAKTPIQIPIPQKSPEIVDLGIFRPSLSINGIVPTTGGGTSTVAGYEGMEVFPYSKGGVEALYYFPYKNKLEEAAYTWIAATVNELELEIGDASTPVATPGNSPPGTITYATGGGVYKVAIQQARFQVDASKEDRWTFAFQFVCKSRGDVTF
jgi:hypothetical protein